jgi:hypothetical protein
MNKLPRKPTRALFFLPHRGVAVPLKNKIADNSQAQRKKLKGRIKSLCSMEFSALKPSSSF